MATFSSANLLSSALSILSAKLVVAGLAWALFPSVLSSFLGLSVKGGSVYLNLLLGPGFAAYLVASGVALTVLRDAAASRSLGKHSGYKALGLVLAIVGATGAVRFLSLGASIGGVAAGLIAAAFAFKAIVGSAVLAERYEL